MELKICKILSKRILRVVWVTRLKVDNGIREPMLPKNRLSHPQDGTNNPILDMSIINRKVHKSSMRIRMEA